MLHSGYWLAASKSHPDEVPECFYSSQTMVATKPRDAIAKLLGMEVQSVWEDLHGARMLKSPHITPELPSQQGKETLQPPT